MAAILKHLGLLAVGRCSRDVKVLIAQRFVRLFAYGASTLILVSFLKTLGHSTSQVGLFMTLTLVGDVAISFVLTLIADVIGRRAILAAGATLMSASGIVFYIFNNYWILLAGAVLGVISPSGNEIGPFRAIEESVVAHLTVPDDRSDVYAWYSLLGTAGTALGMIVCGWVIEGLTHQGGWTLTDAYRMVFVAYAVLGCVKLLLVFTLTDDVEISTNIPQSAETAPLINSASETRPRMKFWRRLLPTISAQSRGVAVSLCLLFALDSFASGLAPLSWVTYYFRSRFSIPEGSLGSIFFVTSIVSAASMLVASALSKRIGNVKTMVFTHLPSAVFLALIPVPSTPTFSLLFLVLRACTQSMDVAPRSAFLAAMLLPNERTAIMGTVNVVKTTAQAAGPLITGVLANNNLFWVSFVCAGSLKALYDLGLLIVFKNHARVKDTERQEQNEAVEA